MGFKLAGGKGLREGWYSKELWKSVERSQTHNPRMGRINSHQDLSSGPLIPSINGHSERSACITSMCAARAAGTIDATTAAVSSTSAERTTGKAPGIFTSKK